MSKSMALVAFAVLMGIVAVVGMSTNVSSKLRHVFTANNASTQLSVGTKAEMGKSQTSSFSVQGDQQSDMLLPFADDGVHCHKSDSSDNPLDD